MNAALLGMLLTLFMASASIIFAVVKNIIDKINQNQSTIPTTIPSENMTIIETTTLETDQISVSTTTSSTIPTQISSTILSTIPITTSSTIPATTQISSTILTTTQLTTSNTIPTIIPSTILSTTPKTNVETVPKTNVQEISTTILTTTTPLPTIIQTTIEYSTIYYPACDNSYSSLVDALKSIGEDSSFSNRKLIAEINGISNYSGTAEENIELLNKLKNGKLIKSISSTIITVPTLDTSNPATPSTTIPLTDESITIPISDTDNIKETDAITDDNEIEDKLIYFSKCDSKYNSIEEALKSIYAFSSYEYRVQIGKVNNIPTDDSAKLNMELLKRLKNGNLIRPSLIVPPFQEIYNKEQIDDMIKKLEESKNTNIQKRKKTLIVMAKLLFNFGYEPAYVAGILGNINGEGDVGQLESSFYRNITLKPKYLIFMDEEYDYAKKYSGKHIYDNLSLVEIKNLLYELAKGGWKGKFGIGCIQWTGVRSIPLINFYLEEIGFKDKITFEQATSAEAKLIINELNYDKEYNNIYKNWKKENTNIDSENAAYNASIKLTKEYEKPATNKAKERAETAKSIYKIMTS